MRKPLPPHTTLSGKRQHGHVNVSSGKPPKLRWKPGSVVELDQQIFEIICAYRVQTEPHEWYFDLEYRKNIVEDLDVIGKVAEAFGAGDETPRIVYEMFRNHGDARTFFFDIPSNGDRRVVSNKTLAKAVLLSSGVVLNK